MSPARRPLPFRVPTAPGIGAPVRPERALLPTDPDTLAPLPAEFHEALAEGISALGLEIDAPRREALDGYVRLLLAWTAAINLTAIREPAAVARDHLVDSLAAVTVLRLARLEGAVAADLGSGGGLPGVPLAIVLPDLRMTLVESVGKKALFLRTAVAALGLAGRVEVAAERSEVLALRSRRRETFDAVTVRAVAALPELIELALPLLRVGGRLVAWKREPLAAELAAGRNAARAIGGSVDVVEVEAPGLRDHRLVIVTKARPTPARYPRNPVERRANPL